jgi:hypothetical protein
LSDKNWEIVSHCQTPSGQYIKRTVVNPQGWVIRQELCTPQNQLVAVAEVNDLQLDRGTGIYYVKRVSMQCQGMEGKMTIDLGTPKFNQSTPFDSLMFVMPTYQGYPAVDLCGPEVLQRSGVLMPPQGQPQVQMPNIPEASMKTVIR